jgi:HEAT repeat protein
MSEVQRYFQEKNSEVSEHQSPTSSREILKMEESDRLVATITKNAEAYRMWGSPSLDSKDVSRYVDSRKKIIAPSSEMIESGLQDKDFYLRLCSVQTIPHVEVGKRAALIQQGLNDSNLAVCEKALQLINSCVEPLAQIILFRKALTSHELSLRIKVAENLVSSDLEVRNALQEELVALSRDCLKEEKVINRLSVFSVVDVLSDRSKQLISDSLTTLVQEALVSSDIDVLQRVLKSSQTFSVQENKKIREKINDVIKTYSTHPDWFERQKGIMFASLLGKSEILTDVVGNALNDSAGPVRQSAVQRLSEIPLEQRVFFVKKAVGDDDQQVMLRAFAALFSLPEELRGGLEIQFRSTLERVLSLFDRSAASRLISSVPTEKQSELIGFLKKIAPWFIFEAEDYASETPLYTKHRERFFKKNFAKEEGAGITLLDSVPGQSEKTLRNKVVVRHMQIGPYMAWRKAYEAVNFWLKNGFDYVPVEPIVSVKNAKRNLTVDVATRVVAGPSSGRWITRFGFYQKHIAESMLRIRKVLEELGIEHRHLHKDNFVINFPITTDGTPLIDHPPRVYVIDFDMAVSKPDNVYST